MRNSYLRPLNFNYVDTFEQKYQTEEIPFKFQQEPDDYQKRQKNHAEPSHAPSSDIDELASAYEPPPIAPSPTEIHPSSTAPQEPSSLVIEPPKVPVYEDTIIEPSPPKKQSASRSLFACCQQKPEESQLCERCLSSLCRDCLSQPLRVRKCTRCLQRLCGGCKQSLGIGFPDYKIRNYPIALKNLSQFHFEGCKCPECGGPT